MLFNERMTQEEGKRFFDRRSRIDTGFKALDRRNQTKVLDMAAKLQWRRLVKLRHGRLLTLKFLCRDLAEEDEIKILEKIESMTHKQQEERG